MWLSTTLPFEEEDAQEVKTIIEEAGQKAVLIPGDLKDESFARQLVHDAAKALDGLDILVLNAGMQQAVKDIKDLTPNKSRTHLQRISSPCIGQFKKPWIILPAGGGIITTTSIKVQNLVLICCWTMQQPKERSLHLVKGLAAQLSSKGIRVNTCSTRTNLDTTTNFRRTTTISDP